MLSQDLAHLAAHLRAVGVGGLDDGLSPKDCDAIAARLEVLTADTEAVEAVSLHLGAPENVVRFPAPGTLRCVE